MEVSKPEPEVSEPMLVTEDGMKNSNKVFSTNTFKWQRFQSCIKKVRFWQYFVIGISISFVLSFIIILVKRNARHSITEEINTCVKTFSNPTWLETEYHNCSLGENTIDPCTDFYEYACQKWNNNNNICESKDECTALGYGIRSIEELVYSILQETVQPDDISALSQAKLFYKLCLSSWNHSEKYLYLEERFQNIRVISRDKICVVLVLNIYRWAIENNLARYFYCKVEDFEEVRAEVGLMFSNIKNWFGSENTSLFTYSANQTKACIGIPSWVFNTTRVEQKYEKWVFDTTLPFHQLFTQLKNFSDQINLDQDIIAFKKSE